MAKPVNTKQVEQIARRLGYKGPMDKFGEFLMSSPARRYADGGVVEEIGEAPKLVSTPTNNVDPKGENVYTPEELANPVNADNTANAPNVDDFNGVGQQFGQTNVDVTRLTSQPGQFIPEGSGQVSGAIPVPAADIAKAEVAGAPNAVNTATYDASLIGNSIDGVVDQFQSAQGTVNNASTVRGQLEGLMQDFEGGNTPAWAAGALRNANAGMAARGLGASSMAGAATTQAAMEAALPIAQQDAATNFQMQLQNLSNEQQKLMLGNQARVNALFTDVASQNAAKQFNATSENQTRQFNESLRSSVETFNVAQVNALRQFNAGQRNSMRQFRATVRNDREKFNATNQLIIDQANAQWRQEIATTNNANINEANRLEAQISANTTLTEMNAYFQARRDSLQYAFEAGENDANRATELLLTQMSIDEAERSGDQASRDALWQTAGALIAEWFR